MNSVQTVTLNNALSQNWVVCTVHTPRNQVARTLRAQCLGHGRCCAHGRLVARMSHAQPAQVARLLGVYLSRHAQAAYPRSRPQIDVSTSLCSSHRNALVATQNLGRDTKPPQGSQNHVATSNQCRDTTQATPSRDLKMGSRHRFSSPAPSQVATPKPGRNPPGD